MGFSPDITEAQKRLFDPDQDAASVLSDWLERNQPCIFRRAAAKLKLIRFCILRESDLTSDDVTLDIIQNARLRWTKDAFDGKASAFVILLISPAIVNAVPNANVQDIAHRLTSRNFAIPGGSAGYRSSRASVAGKAWARKNDMGMVGWS